jgi:uncharacterized peroxidase-related enzyme
MAHLSMADRELIATYVSSRNDCYYCQTSHGALAAYHLGGNENLVLDVKRNFESADISEKLKALLAIAGKVQQSGKDVRGADVEHARGLGATDQEIHDTVPAIWGFPRTPRLKLPGAAAPPCGRCHVPG